MKRMASYGCSTITIDNRDREERIRQLEAEVTTLRAEVQRLRAANGNLSFALALYLPADQVATR